MALRTRVPSEELFMPRQTDIDRVKSDFNRLRNPQKHDEKDAVYVNTVEIYLGYHGLKSPKESNPTELAAAFIVFHMFHLGAGQKNDQRIFTALEKKRKEIGLPDALFTDEGKFKKEITDAFIKVAEVFDSLRNPPTIAI